VKNIFITGPSRSGTSLACALLNQLPDCVALNEPFTVKGLDDVNWKDNEVIYEKTLGFATEMRDSLLNEGKAWTRGSDRLVNSDPVANSYTVEKTGLSSKIKTLFLPSPKSQLRKVVHRRKVVRFDKNLDKGFTLALKHNMIFTGLLPLLKHQHDCFAMIRNPLSTLLSWNTIDFDLGEGVLPYWFQHWLPEIYTRIMELPDKLDRQICLLEWMYEQYEIHLRPDQIFSYEDMISSGGKSLSVIVPSANSMNTSIESRNKNKLYFEDLTEKIAVRLLKKSSALWSFYTKDDIAADL